MADRPFDPDQVPGREAPDRQERSGGERLPARNDDVQPENQAPAGEADDFGRTSPDRPYGAGARARPAESRGDQGGGDYGQSAFGATGFGAPARLSSPGASLQGDFGAYGQGEHYGAGSAESAQGYSSGGRNAEPSGAQDRANPGETGAEERNYATGRQPRSDGPPEPGYAPGAQIWDQGSDAGGIGRVHADKEKS